MRKQLLSVLLAVSLISSFSAQETAAEEIDSAVPRYTGFSVGAYFLNQYALGDWSDFANANIGGGLGAEYTLPQFLPFNIDLGASIRSEFAHVFPKSGSTLKSDDQLNFSLGAWLRFPFLLAGQSFAFQPELSYGVILHHAKGQNGSAVDGWFTDSTLTLALGLRYTARAEFLKNIEFELSPVYTFSPEKENKIVNYLGFRMGAVWHFNK